MNTTHRDRLSSAVLSEQTRKFLALMGAIEDIIKEFNGICPDALQRESIEDGGEEEYIYEKIIDHLAEARSGFQTIMFQGMEERMYNLNCTEI